MAEQYNLSPGSTLTTVNLLFKVRDKATGVIYNGICGIGVKKPLRPHPDELIKREVLKWIGRIRFTEPPLSKMIIKWDMPDNQQYIDVDFASKFLVIDLQKSLGVSNQELFSTNFELISLDIHLTSIPKDSTVIVA